MHVEFTAAARYHPAGVIDSAEVSEIATYYDLLPTTKRLAILGEPGAGKTVAGTHLVLGLLDARRELPDARRAEEPVPVRFNAASWNGTEDLSGWLTTRLGLDYRLRPPLARALIEAGQVLPVLDGLDEMDADDTEEPRARAALDRLNETPWRNRPVVVVCRSREFESLAHRGGDNGLHGAAAITLRSFAADQIEIYLNTYRQAVGATTPAWDRIIDQPDGPLATALDTPWMLGLAAVALHHTPDAADQLIGCPDSDAVRGLLFAAQIPAAVAGTTRNGSFRNYSSDNVETWMQSLARCLDHRRDTGRDGTSIRLDEIWEIAGTTSCRLLHVLAVMLVAGLVIGPWGGLTGILLYGLPVIITAAIYKYPPARRIAWRVPGRSRWRRGLTTGLAVGLFGATFTSFGPAVGLAVGLTVGLSVNEKDRLRLSVDERDLIRADIQFTALTAGLSGLVTGLGILATVVAISRIAQYTISTIEFTNVLTICFAATLLLGLAVLLAIGTASSRYFIATLVFRFKGPFPARPRLFLDWARRSGLLRVTSTAYQFRHETYRQWLQQHRTNAETPSSHQWLADESPESDKLSESSSSPWAAD